jgi:hypothetical protein
VQQFKKVFGLDSFSVGSLKTILQKHLLPLPPIQLDHHLNPAIPDITDRYVSFTADLMALYVLIFSFFFFQFIFFFLLCEEWWTNF